MTFLKNIDSFRRLEIQFKAFLATKNLSFLESIIEIPSFECEFNEYAEVDISELKINNNLRLGNRLEQFLSFAFSLSSDFNILAKNIQVVEDKITLGELDYIIQDKRNDKTFHLELANKFYLYDKNILNEQERWIGPNRNDSLIRKITKLKEKQFPLLYHQQTAKILEEFNIDFDLVEQKLLFKTQLFLPEYQYKSNKKSDNVEGFYIYEKEFQQNKYHDNLFFLPEKQDWQVDPIYSEVWFTYEEIQASIKMFLAENKSPLVWMKDLNEKCEKFFVVWW